MTLIYLLVLVTQSSALKYTLPRDFGGKTDYSDKGWRGLLRQLLVQGVKFGQFPVGDINIAEEYTCFNQYSKCSTTYFGKELTMEQPESAKFWVKWHEDATPLVNESPDGCIVSSENSVVDLTSQSNGWKVSATTNAKFETIDNLARLNGPAGALKVRYRDTMIASKTMTSRKTLSAKCSPYHLCYIQTGTLMVNVTGMCDSEPLLICNRRIYPCPEFKSLGFYVCSQWYDFAQKHCKHGVSRVGKEECSLSVAVTGENGEPISFQVFEQKPMPGKGSVVYYDHDTADNPYSELLPDGSSGAWMAWRP